MLNQRRLRDYGIKIGKLEPGALNSITDVKGVKVGHKTLSNDQMQTGVTAIIPHGGNIFLDKFKAASYIINGYGKSTGLMQLNELGTIETPIILTNTLNVGVAADGLVEYMLTHNQEIGNTTGTVNPVVCECNDMQLNDIRQKYVQKQDILDAIQTASSHFLEGSVGAGRGMVCYTLKGGIGTASRIMPLPYGTYSLGVLVLTNFGQLPDLSMNGRPLGKELLHKTEENLMMKDKGSIVIIVATDLPVSQRQLQRVIKRSVTGLSRTGANLANGSGDVVVGFSTATIIPHHKKNSLIKMHILHDEDLDIPFKAVGEATEEAILNSLITAEAVTGKNGASRPALRDLVAKHSITL
ncbi:P1 family peptidase [Salipaludibacillus agaradhaerens]|uniref:P1 family peptidase n=1 Tax=Salipaludibacillus agaradhaerens TaxID=76935 RepID=A0A9Q4B0U8_SALAG|nr:P1 family peptidase [Salipaludibacillus agaradhaerens]MCR6096249.1 P1 family peptidase [Salipaludibacillus agaradhaerens]MCR6114192.1 P1 family peptidase [Salipaludibacillus agaradhaerens]UJW57953.1 P1 family peptidase [Bacillus sp. A116_S68]